MPYLINKDQGMLGGGIYKSMRQNQNNKQMEDSIMSNMKDAMTKEERDALKRASDMGLTHVSKARTGNPAVLVLEKALESFRKATQGTENECEQEIDNAVWETLRLIRVMYREHRENQFAEKLTGGK